MPGRTAPPRRTRPLTAVLVSLLSGGLGCGGERAAAPPQGPGEGSVRTQRYLALGDSYTIGESVDVAERFPDRLAALLREQGVGLADPTIIAR
ncbi:MAG TPA: hypothetical protein VFT43_14660, partial [Candidatus Polarisedimenticolia bacterium]|nr:hypothetical protein [Candidatus Polarisedimenticolia bacterium]